MKDKNYVVLKEFRFQLSNIIEFLENKISEIDKILEEEGEIYKKD